jgi:hypothetical protein
LSPKKDCKTSRLLDVAGLCRNVLGARKRTQMVPEEDSMLINKSLFYNVVVWIVYKKAPKKAPI